MGHPCRAPHYIKSAAPDRLSIRQIGMKGANVICVRSPLYRVQRTCVLRNLLRVGGYRKRPRTTSYAVGQAQCNGAAFSLQVDEPDWRYTPFERNAVAGEGRLQSTRIRPSVAQAKEGSVEAQGASAAHPARKEGLERIDLVRSSEEPRTPPPCGATSVRCWRRTARIGRVGTYAVDGVGRCAGGAAFNAAVNEKGPAMPGLSSGGGSHQPLRPPRRPGADHPLLAAAGGVIRR